AGRVPPGPPHRGRRRAAGAPQRAGPDDRGDRHGSAGGAPGRREPAWAAVRRLHRLRGALRRGGRLRHRERDDGGRLQHRLPAGDGCDPRRRHRRHLAGRREVQHHRRRSGCPAHRDARQDGGVPGDLLLGDPGVQGHRDHRPVPAAVRTRAGAVPGPAVQDRLHPVRRTEGGCRSMSAAITTPPEAPTRSRLERVRLQLLSRADSLPTVAALVIFVLMLFYGEFAYGRIFQLSTVSNLFINNAHLIILAVGLTFVIISGGIDLSVGAIIALSSVTGVMLANAGWNAWLVILVMILIGALIGLASGVLIQYFDVQPFIATLAMMFLGRGLA